LIACFSVVLPNRRPTVSVERQLFWAEESQLASFEFLSGECQMFLDLR
jgi:hypothetical protein